MDERGMITALVIGLVLTLFVIWIVLRAAGAL
jgi:hypothetical protein